ncbi:MAG: TatD family hydrolase [Prevotella sp.]|nr:TatD family hydrolase [Prevotella sp.]
MEYIDTHAHIDGNEYNQDRETVIGRAREAGCSAIFVPAIDLSSSQRILALCQSHPDFLYPMVGLHPEEVRADWQEQLNAIKLLLHAPATPLIAIGEVGLDYYWSREFEQEQMAAFEEQVRWSIETRLPLMIHCRKAQNEMVTILKRYACDLPGGVFHCFTGNAVEAAQLLQFEQFMLGIGGVLTFKKSHLPEVLSETVPLSRIVLETDSPYMAPVPMRGQRNEPSYVRHIITIMAQAYGVDEERVAEQTTLNAKHLFLHLP